MLNNLLSLCCVIITNFFLNKDLENIVFKFINVSSVLPDFEITIKHEFFKFLIFLNFKNKFGSKLSKKK